MINENDCISWQGAKDHFGYGIKKQHGKTYRTHRLAWISAYGEIPQDKQVLHKCDNPSCININHLYLGTPQDNVHDRVIRSRGRHGNNSKGRPPKGNSAMKPILVDIPDDLRERLRNLKEATSLPVNEIIRRAVVFYLDHPEASPNNTYRDHGQGSDNEPPAGTA